MKIAQELRQALHRRALDDWRSRSGARLWHAAVKVETIDENTAVFTITPLPETGKNEWPKERGLYPVSTVDGALNRIETLAKSNGWTFDRTSYTVRRQS